MANRNQQSRGQGQGGRQGSQSYQPNYGREHRSGRSTGSWEQETRGYGATGRGYEDPEDQMMFGQGGQGQRRWGSGQDYGSSGYGQSSQGDYGSSPGGYG